MAQVGSVIRDIKEKNTLCAFRKMRFPSKSPLIKGARGL